VTAITSRSAAAAAACSVGASTITRTRGSVPLWRNSTRGRRGLLRRRFDHHPHQGFGAALAQQHPAPPSERGFDGANLRPHRFRPGEGVAIVDGDVAEHLGQPLHHGGSQLGEGLPCSDHEVEQQQTGQHPVAGRGQVPKDQVSGLLAAE
jgi:hypothetical protein